MSNSPNNPPPSPNHKDVLPLLKGLAKNDGFLKWLSEHAVVGNFILTVLTGYSLANFVGMFLPESFDPDLIGKTEECVKRSEDPSTEVVVLSADPSELQNDTGLDMLFGCRYIDAQANELQETEYMRLQSVRKDSLEGNEYREEKITEANLDAICDNEEYFLPKLSSRFRPETHIIEPKGAEYVESAKSVYPVFRWACKYSVNEKGAAAPQDPLNSDSQSTGSSMGPQSVYTGISLDEHHCIPTYKSLELRKATYHDFNDPNSWHCTKTDAVFGG